jgi:hypothetical protein
VTELITSVGAFQAELASLQGEISALENGAATLGVAVMGFVADLIAVNIDISAFESDVK